MKVNTPLRAATLMAAISAAVAADTPAKAADADYSRIVFENDKVRIILYHTTTGKNLCGFGMHSHPAHAYIQLQPAKFKVTTPAGKEEVIEVPAGDAGWEPAVTHRVEALSPTTVDVYLIETKDKDWKPSTRLTAGEGR